MATVILFKRLRKGNLVQQFHEEMACNFSKEWKTVITDGDASSKVKHHSIPLIEMCGAVLGTQSTADIIINYPNILHGSLEHDKIFKIRQSIDSKCCKECAHKERN